MSIDQTPCSDQKMTIFSPASRKLKRHVGNQPLSGQTEQYKSVAAGVHGMLGLVLLLASAPALAEPKTYPDGHGGEVVFPEGDISFADEVVHYDTGDKEPISSARNPKAALGVPDYNEQTDSNFVSLGCGGELVLKL